MLNGIDAAWQALNRLRRLFRRPAQDSHDKVIRCLRVLERLPLTYAFAAALRHLTFSKSDTDLWAARAFHSE